ncbi:MAG: phosphatidylglycerophosphatase A [Rhodobacterales bacterium]|jgi:phosphatidylglycerophosphatase A|nr:phosphatidylglycerophosphatase A [Rhodobacterales bacterium]
MNLIATLGGIGNIRPAPGTWGSLAALPLALVLMLVGGPTLFVIGIVVVAVAGWFATKSEMDATLQDDPQQVVIDEVLGQWIALLPVSLGAASTGVSLFALWPGWVSAFLLFRLFDIWKPGPVGWADRREDALGVMLDDAIAGAFAAVGVALLAGIAHGIMAVT